MAKISYTKPFTNFADQIIQLKERGLRIDNEEKACHLLMQVSYYRLSGYWHPLLQDKILHKFKPDASFDTAFKIYCFDKELRKIVVSEIEKIEIAVRSKLIYNLSESYGAFWFTESKLFKSSDIHTKTLLKLAEEYKRSDEEFIKAFYQKYNDEYPPSWMILEITSFGTLSQLFRNLSSAWDKRKIANYFGLNEKVFENWLHSIVYLRNVCAHHCRLWNRVLSIKP